MCGMTSEVHVVRSPGSLTGGESNLTLAGLVMRFAQLANLTGQPSISLPVGADSSGTAL